MLEDCKMSTPWGTAQQKQVHARGLFTIHTAGHGGLVVSRGLAQKVLSQEAINCAAIVTSSYVFFEEDCAVSVAIVDSPYIRKELAATYGRTAQELHDQAMQSVRRWFPKYFEVTL